MKVYYIVDIWEKDELDIKGASEFETDRDIHSAHSDGYDDFEITWLIEDICKDYYSNRDGWEMADRWSMAGVEVALWDENKTFVGKYHTTLEYNPDFWVSKIPD